MEILIKPVVSEKMTDQTEKLKRYGFVVNPAANKIEIKKEAKVRRAKLYFLRDYKKRLKEKLLG